MQFINKRKFVTLKTFKSFSKRVFFDIYWQLTLLTVLLTFFGNLDDDTILNHLQKER